MKFTGWFPNHPFGRQPAPRITAVVTLPRLRTPSKVEFMIDTGCERTVLHPIDSHALGIDLRAPFPDNQPLRGIGGAVSAIEETAVVTFRADHGGGVDITEVVLIAQQTAANDFMPSLLGRDFLRYFILTMELERKYVALEFSADSPLIRKKQAP